MATDSGRIALSYDDSRRLLAGGASADGRNYLFDTLNGLATDISNIADDWQDVKGIGKGYIVVTPEGSRKITGGAQGEYTSEEFVLTAEAKQQLLSEGTEGNKKEKAAASAGASRSSEIENALREAERNYAAKRRSLSDIYTRARNLSASDSARASRAFAERAAASGLASGASSQEALARGLELQRALGEIDLAEAEELSELEKEYLSLMKSLRAAKEG